MKVVLDTNCMVVILLEKSPYYCIWKAFREKRFAFCVTTDILNEYYEILSRFYPQVFVDNVINELLLSKNVQKINNYYQWNLISADADILNNAWKKKQIKIPPCSFFA